MGNTNTPSPPSLFLVLLLSLLSLATLTLANKTTTQTFTYVNEGEFGPYITEYDASYRVLPLASSPFQMAFYNTTPGQFFLALRMGTRRSESTFRWVWEFNRGHPVGENATFSLLSNGNLVLAEADGKVAFSSNTAFKGVVGLRILPTGNIVLYDGANRFVWQSFDYPTDTLLVGQSLRLGGPTRLISRKSATDGSFGAYSLVLEADGLALYINNVTFKPLPYYKQPNGYLSAGPVLTSATFQAEPETEEAYAYEVKFLVSVNNTPSGSILFARPKYNATLSFLRLQIDGNLIVYTYYDPVDYQAWEKTFAFFSDEKGRLEGCQLPGKCGSLGVCQQEMCVACPTPKGLLGWSDSCAVPAVGCKGGAAVGYYKVEGVENFLSSNTKGEGAVGLKECERRCSKDCKCLGFLYWKENKKCWLAPLVGTLNKVSTATHHAYIKYSK